MDLELEALPAAADDRGLSRLAVAALVDEAELTPKPALVDRRSAGAHHDLDLAALRRSALSLEDGFAAIARASADRLPSRGLREELGRIGREMERRMLAVTGGSNSHRGAIWALGLLVAGAARRPLTSASRRVRPEDVAAAAAAIARLSDRFARPSETHGRRVCARHGVGGARGEAAAGFPHAVHLGLPALRAARAGGASESSARLDALMAIMARLDDTCLLHRGGPAALAAARSGAAAVLAAGGTRTRAGLARLHALHGELMRAWASPGGSGDLLAATLLLDRLDRLDATGAGGTRWRP